MAIPAELQLKLQGDFRVAKAGKPLDDLYAPLGQFPEGQIRARQRIQWVEIETSLGAVDSARVHFVDPERVVAGYVAEQYREGGKNKYEPWQVSIGYAFAPENTWATFTGIPLIEDVLFPPNGVPEVTIRLLSAGIVLQKHNSSLQDGVMSRHWMYGPDDPPSLKKALQAMAQAYGCSLYLGSLDKVITKMDEHLERHTYLTTNYLTTHWVPGPSVSYVQSRADNISYLAALETIAYQLMDPRLDDVTDWKYLKMWASVLQPIVNEEFPEQTGGVSDELWTGVKNAGNDIAFGIRGDKLFFCRLRDIIDNIDEIVVYSYHCNDNSLLEFQASTYDSTAGSDTLNLIQRIFGKRDESTDLVDLQQTSTEVMQAITDASQMRVDVSPSDSEAGLGAISRRHFFRLSSASNAEWQAEAAASTVLGVLSTNLRANITVLGSPFLRAGKLIGTYGLGVGPENRPTPDTPQRINSYDRVWLIATCTHRCDDSGLMLTKLQTCGATTDNSADIIKALMAATEASLEPKAEKRKGFMEMLGLLFGGGESQFPWEGR